MSEGQPMRVETVRSSGSNTWVAGWLEQEKIITSLDLAKRKEILPGLQHVHWDFVIVDEAHRMSAADETHKSLRYKLGELLRDTTEHMLLLTATPHKGDPLNFSLFLQLLDADAYADVRSIREAMDCRRATFYSLQHEGAARIDFYRARVVDGLGQVIHERLFAVEVSEGGELRLREPSLLGNFTRANPPDARPPVATLPEAAAWLNEHVLAPFFGETRKDRLGEVERISAQIELSLTELLQRADEEIGRVAAEVEQKTAGAEGRLAQAEARHSELPQRRERRRKGLDQQRALSLQAEERMASVLVLPHPERETPEVQRLQPKPETEAGARRVVMDHEPSQSRQVYDAHEKNLGYDVTSLDVRSGQLSLIEVKGLADVTGTILLTPNERRVAEDRRDYYWLCVVTNCGAKPQLGELIKDPARFEWHEVAKAAHYYLSVDALTRPMHVREESPPYGSERP